MRVALVQRKITSLTVRRFEFSPSASAECQNYSAMRAIYTKCEKEQNDLFYF